MITRKLKTLIVMPRIAYDDELYQFPTGVAYVSAALKAAGKIVHTLNLNYKKDYINLLKKVIVEQDIDIVAVGGLSGQYKSLKEITDIAKTISRDIITVVGGGIITADPESAMKAIKTADYGVIGEGEITLPELVDALECGGGVENVSGLILGNGKRTAKRFEIMDLDSLEFPDYDGFDFVERLSKDNPGSLRIPSGLRSATIVSSRSCKYNCTFCFHSSGVKYRKRSLSNVFDEIDFMIKKFGIDSIIIQDEMFIDDIVWFEGFCCNIKKRYLKWWCQSRVDNITEEILRLMKDSGCVMVAFGVESADNLVLKSMRKNITVEQIENAFNLAEKVGISTSANIILGDISDTRETIYTSFNWWVKHHIRWNISLNWIWVFPGSFLYKYAIKKGIIKDAVDYIKNDCPQINITTLVDKDYWRLNAEIELLRFVHETSDSIIETDNFRVLKNNLKKIIGRKIVIWPATVAYVGALYNILPEFILNENLYLVNRKVATVSTSESQITEKYGKQLFSPDICEKGIEVIISPNRLAIFEEIKNYIAFRFPKTRVIHISELFERGFLTEPL